MSYVLDALEKSERERQQYHPPNLLSVHTTEPSFSNNRRKKKLYLIYGFFLLLLILLVGVILAISLPTKQKTAAQDQPVTAITPRQRRIIINPEVATVTSQNEYYFKTRDEFANIIAEKKKMRFLTPAEADPIREQPGTTSDSIPLFKDLPAETQKEIPELRFSGHAFSTVPGRRMIIVNSQILKEGDSIDSITTLKEITWEGAVIDFGGILFRIENQ